MNLLMPMHEHALMHPLALAAWIDSQEWSYAQLLEKVQAVAGWIVGHCKGDNPRIGILAGRHITAYVGILASSYSGAAYVPLNVKAPHAYLTEILQTARIDALIVDRVGIDILTRGPLDCLPEAILSPFDPVPAGHQGKTIAMPADLAALPPLSNPISVSPADHAYLMFTSGTTGKPKGITITVENIQHLLNALQQRYRFSPEDRVSQAFELTFDLSVFDIFMALGSGASLHVVPDHQMPIPAHFIQQQKLTVWFSVPSMIGMLKQMRLLGPKVFPSLRLSLFCGEALPEESARAWQDAAPNSQVENLYGPTEATVACLLQDCKASKAVTPGRGIIAIGQPFEGLSAGIANHDGHFLSPGERGELAIHGPQVAPGYLNNEELTQLRFPTLKHPQLGLSRWYLTGDLAYMDNDGRYHFLGRIDNQVQLRGYRVELDEIEHHLREVSGCDNAVAIFIDQHEIWAQEIIGVVTACPIESGEIRKQLATRLPPYMVPKRIFVCDTLPRNASGKIDRKAVKHQFLKNPDKDS